jgi:hypothetical protein
LSNNKNNIKNIPFTYYLGAILLLQKEVPMEINELAAAYAKS